MKDPHDIRKAAIEDEIIARSEEAELFVIHKPIHDPFGYYRENAYGYTTLSDAWRVPWDVAMRYVSGRPTDPDRVIAEPAPPRKEETELAQLRAKCERLERERDEWKSSVEAVALASKEVEDALLAVIEQCEKAFEKINGFGKGDLTAGELSDYVNEVSEESLAAIKRVKEGK